MEDTYTLWCILTGINRKPVTEDLEVLGFPTSQSGDVNIPRYPIKFGFYKDGFWLKLYILLFKMVGTIILAESVVIMKLTIFHIS